MPFGSLSSAQQILVLLSLRGGGAYEAQMAGAATQTSRLGKAILTTSAEMNIASKRTFLHNQLMFTARRLLFYTTLGFIGLGAEVARLGFSYLNTVQSARVALRGLFPTTAAMDAVINKLYVISTLSPFLFKDVLQSFRTLYPAFKAVGFSAALTVRTMQAVVNALAEAGRTGPGQMTKIGVQLQHLANIGRPTGQVLLALARDGLPVWPALRTQLHLTGQSLASVAATGVTAKQVIIALDQYIERSKAFSHAAVRLANQTLQGSWRQFLDIISQSAGRGEAGLFGGLHKILFDINKQLAPMLMNNKPITLYNIANAIDHAISPRTHLIINLFVTINTALHTTIALFGGLLLVIQTILRPFDYLASLFGINHLAARLLGIAIGVLTTLILLQRTALIFGALALDAFKFSIAGVRAAVILTRYAMVAFRFTMLATNVVIGFGTAVMNSLTVATLAWLSAITLGIAALIILYEKWHRFHIAVNQVLQTPIGIPHSAAQIDRSQAASRSHKHKSLWQKLDNWGYFPGLASGGQVMRSGMSWVGERGPELVNMPRGAVVQPLKNNILQGLGQLAIYVYPQDIYLDGQKIGTAVATAVADAGARL